MSDRSLRTAADGAALAALSAAATLSAQMPTTGLGATQNVRHGLLASGLELIDSVGIDDPIAAASLPAVEMRSRDSKGADLRPDVASTASPGR